MPQALAVSVPRRRHLSLPHGGVRGPVHVVQLGQYRGDIVGSAAEATHWVGVVVVSKPI